MSYVSDRFLKFVNSSNLWIWSQSKMPVLKIRTTILYPVKKLPLAAYFFSVLFRHATDSTRQYIALFIFRIYLHIATKHTTQINKTSFL